MLEFEQILSSFQQSLHFHKKFILREYLQYKLLEAIYCSPFAGNLVFMGGTSIHIIHGSSRFSEDLDFDNRGLSAQDFKSLVNEVQKQIQRQGIEVEAETATEGPVFHAHVYFIKILQKLALSGHKNEKLLIRIDSQPQNYNYISDIFLLNKFDVFQKINATPAPLLLAKKITAALERKRPMGRDFYDITFLYRNTELDYGYLKKHLGIRNIKMLKEGLIKRCQPLDFNLLANDVEPFLYHSSDKKRVSQFMEFVEGLSSKEKAI